MGLKICSLASGSRGNCCYIANGSGAVLIDMGISTQRAQKCLSLLGCEPANTGILVTHCHNDHISGLDTFVSRYDVPVFCPVAVSRTVKNKLGKKGVNASAFYGNDFFVGTLTVSPFFVSHDVPCVGYSVLSEGKKISVLTDLGVMNEDILAHISDSDIVMIEANHDVGLLAANPRYHYQLKRRILSDQGHLSNDACADAVSKMASRGVKNFILAHLSEENNYPELAVSTVKARLEEDGIDGVRIDAALQNLMTGLYEVS